jgi:hypothetical protein
LLNFVATTAFVVVFVVAAAVELKYRLLSCSLVKIYTIPTSSEVQIKKRSEKSLLNILTSEKPN